MPLTDSEIDAFAPQEKSYKRADGRGLHIFVTRTGSKLWRVNYRFQGKQKTLSVGAWPVVTLELSEPMQSASSGRTKTRAPFNSRERRVGAAARPPLLM